MCAATGRLPLSLLRRYFPAATGEHSQKSKLNILINAGLVFEGPLGLTAVPSKISSSLEGQVAVFCFQLIVLQCLDCVISQLIFLLPEPSFDYLVISDPTSPEMVSDFDI